MRIGVIARPHHAHEIALDNLREHAKKKVHFALRRFEDRVRSVTVRIVDENGPRKGVDTRCVIAAEFEQGAPLVVHATAARPEAAVTRAAHRLNEAVRRRLDAETWHRPRSADLHIAWQSEDLRL